MSRKTRPNDRLQRSARNGDVRFLQRARARPLNRVFDRTRGEKVMNELRIKMTKRPDGSVVSRFERADGTVTWQHKQGPQARFFALHDLEHYAVESTLRHRRGFYGLVAEGWDVSDFGTPWPRGPLPPDVEPAEVIVGFLDSERASGERWTAAEFNEQAAVYFGKRGAANPVALSDEQLFRIRAAVHELWKLWDGVPDGATLELTFALD